MNCHNCSLPDTGNGKGHNVTITIKPENGYQRQRKATVWTCCKECAVQAVGVAKYGLATHRWPISLAQLRSTVRLG